MTSASKIKGNFWERQVAADLSKMYNASFIRVPNSGAYIGAKNSHRKQFLHEGQIRSFKGDIIPGQEFSKMNIECKSYADFPFHQLFQGSIKKLDEWIDQIMQVADPDDFSILIMKFNRKGKFVAVKQNSLLTYSHYFLYKHDIHGIWAFMDYDIFWQLNKDSVAQLSK